MRPHRGADEVVAADVLDADRAADGGETRPVLVDQRVAGGQRVRRAGRGRHRAGRHGRRGDRPRGCRRWRSAVSSAGNDSQLTLQPAPTTSASPSASARRPASLRSAHQEVVGPLEHDVDRGHLLDRTGQGHPRRHHRPAGDRPRWPQQHATSSDEPGGASQVRPSRPRPAVWWSATTTRPSPAPARAASRTWRLVESSRANHSTRHGPRAEVRAGAGIAVGYGDLSPEHPEGHVFTKVLIANRGEIAVRVIRACRELGIATVAVYSELDRDALHVRFADEAYALGGQTAAESYLNTEAILDAIEQQRRRGGAPRLRLLLRERRLRPGDHRARRRLHRPAARGHRGHGRQGLVAASRARGGRRARRARHHRVPSSDAAEVVAFGDEFGWPVAIKAAYGGGGRGMKVVAQRRRGRRGARVGAARGRGVLRPRRVLRRALPHVAAPRRDADRRRHARQRRVGRRARLLGAAPPPEADRGEPGARAARRRSAPAMGEAAVKVAKACGYFNAGTVEFLYQDGEFFFLEMNTRLQVEHPRHRGGHRLDLVAEQIRVAAGEPLSFTQDDIDAHAATPSRSASTPRTRPAASSCRPRARSPSCGCPAASASAATAATRRATTSQPVLRQPRRQAHRVGPDRDDGASRA